MEITAYRSRRKLVVFLAWCLLLMFAWGLWLWQLDASDLTADESFSYLVSSKTPAQTVAYVQQAVREHPPTYYVLLHSWMVLAGSSEYSLRLLTVFMGMVSLTLVGWVAHQSIPALHGVASVVPAIILAATPGMVYYARVARVYSLMVALTLLSAGVFLRYWLRARTWPHWTGIVGLAVVHLVAFFTHYYLVLPMLVEPLILLVQRRWKPLLAWCGAHIVPALAGLAWLLASPGLQLTTRGVRPILAIPTRFQLLHLLGKLLFSPVVRVKFGLLNVILVLIGLGLLVAFWQDRTVGVWLSLSLLVSPALAFAVPHFPPPRYILYALPYASLALGSLCTLPSLLAKGRHRPVALGASAGLALVAASLLARGGLSQAITFERSRYGRILETVKAHARPGDAILLYGPWQEIQLRYYDPGGLPPIVALPERAPPRLRPDEAEPVLRDLMERYNRLWVLPAAVSDVDPEYFVGSWLRENAHNVWETSGYALYLPALPPGSGGDGQPLTFGQTLELEEVWHDPQPVPAGEALRVALIWNPLRSIERHVQVTLSLVDTNDHTWAVARSVPGNWATAAETWVPGRVVIDRDGLIVPQGTPPGSYTVRLMVSDYDTGTPLSAGGSQEIDLLTFRVIDPVHPPVLYGLPNPDGATFCSPDGSRCIALAGYSPGGYRFQQGYPVPFTLHWLSEEAPAPDIQLRLNVVHDPWLPWEQSTPIVTVTLPSPWSYAGGPPFCRPATPSEEPSSAARKSMGRYEVVLPLVLRGDECVQPAPDRMVTLPAAVMIPPDAPTGHAQVTLEVIGPDGRLWSTTEGNTSLPLFELDVEGRPAERSLPRDLTPIQVDFGDTMALRGYRVAGDARPGGQLRATYAWYARQRPTEIYAVFNHLTTSDGTMVAQVDGWPLDGRLLTKQWEPGEYVQDTHTLQIPADAPPGPYTLYVGLYNAATGERQPAIQDGQLVPDGRVPIPLPGGEDR